MHGMFDLLLEIHTRDLNQMTDVIQQKLYQDAHTLRSRNRSYTKMSSVISVYVSTTTNQITA